MSFYEAVPTDVF